MFTRKLATLSLMVMLLGLGFAVLSGCDDNEIEKAHFAPNIGTDPATGGQAPVVAEVEDTSDSLPAPAPAAPGAPAPAPNPAGAPLFGTGVNGQKIFLGCEGDIDAEGNQVLDYDCATFLSQAQAKSFKAALDARAPGNSDCHGLDGRKGSGDDDGIFCTSRPAN